MKHRFFMKKLFVCFYFIMLIFSSGNAAVYYQSITMTEGETMNLNAWALSDAQYDVGDKTWIDASSNIVVLQTSDYSAKILALSSGGANITHKRVYYNGGKKYDYIYYEIYIKKSSYPKLQITPSTQSNRVFKGTVLTLTPSVSGSTVYYSTSGNVIPGKSSTFPATGLTINSNTAISAQAVKSGYPLSDVFTHTYNVIEPADFSAKVAGGSSIYFKVLNESSKTCSVYYVSETETGELNIPEQINGYTVTQIGAKAFLDCSKLTVINLPTSITSIKSNSFEGCCSLNSISIPQGVTEIGYQAFKNCTGLASVVIPNTMMTIGAEAFAGCNALRSITSYIHNPFVINENVFAVYDSTVTLNIPFGTKSKYDSTSGWMQFSKKVEVPDPNVVYVKDIVLNKTDLTLDLSKDYQLEATISPANAADQSVVWSSSDETVATVSSNGKVTAKAVGNAIVTCTANDGSGVKVTCAVTVRIPVSSITLNKSEISLNVNGQEQLTATVLPNDATNKNVIWSSDQESVATVDSMGKVTAKGGGTATIICTADDGSGVKATCVVTVRIPVSSITLNKTVVSLKVNKQEQLTATVLPEDATEKSVTWMSDKESVATIDHFGKVKAISAGTATIICTANDGSGVKATCNIVVNDPDKPKNISIPEEATVAAGSTITLTPEITPADAETTLTWASDDETVATVDADGVVTGVKKGMTFITVTTDNGLEAFCELTVTEPVAPEPTAIAIPDKLSVSVGQKMKIDYTLTPENAETIVTWTISKDIATIDADGFVTGKAEGLAVVKATTTNGLTSNACRLTVTPATEINADVNGDGTVDVADISSIISVMAGQSGNITEKSADVNGDGNVDVADISTVITRMAELARMHKAFIEE